MWQNEKHSYWSGPTRAERLREEARARRAELAKISRRNAPKKW